MNRSIVTPRTVVIALAIAALAVFPFLGLRLYFLQLGNMLGITLILLLGLNLIFGYTGQISIAQAGFYGIGAYTAALLNVKLGWPFPACVAGAILAPALVSAIMGPPILRLRGFYLALATIALGTVTYEVFEQWKDLTGGPIGVIGIARPDYLKSPTAYFYAVWVAAILVILLVRNLTTCAYGRALMAIRENEVSASTLGINLAHFKLVAFVASSAIAGLAGALYAFMTTYVSPDSFALNQSMMLIAAMVIGQAGSIMGAILGAGLLVLVPELTQISPQLNMLLFGLALVLTLRFAPRGLWGFLSGTVGRRLARGGAPAMGGKPAGGRSAEMGVAE